MRIRAKEIKKRRKAEETRIKAHVKAHKRATPAQPAPKAPRPRARKPAAPAE